MPTSEDFLNKYTAQSAANEGVLGYVKSTPDFLASNVIAFGTNLWNSLVAIPDWLGVDTSGLRLDTYDTIKAVNDNWGEFYDRNRDTIETTSFIAGAILPAGLALKGMKALQAGKFGLYPEIIADASQTARRAELVSMLESGGKATSEFTRLRRSILATDVAQQFGQAIGAEVAIVAAMNQSPLMEDYIKDPVKNFALGLTIGGVIGGTLGHVALRSSLAKELGAVESAAVKAVQDKVIPMPLNANYVDTFQRYVYQAQELKLMSEDTSFNALTRDFAAKQANILSGIAGELERKEIFIGRLGKLLEKPDTPDAQIALKQARDIISQPYSFGANTIDLAHFNVNELKNLDALMQGQALQIQAKVKQAVKEGFVGPSKNTFFAKGIEYRNITNSSKDGGTVIALNKAGEEVGKLQYNTVALEDGTRFNPSVQVLESYRRQGIASTMYDLAKQNGALIPSLDQAGQARSVEGLAFRKAYDKSKSRIDFEGMQQQLISELTAMAEDAARQRMSLQFKETLKDSPDWQKLQKGAGRVFYSPEFKVYAIEKDAKQILRAVDIGKTKPQTLNIGKLSEDAADILPNRGISSAFADELFIDALHTVAKFPLSAGKVFINEHDIPVMQAWLNRFNQVDFTEPLPKIMISSFQGKGAESVSQSVLMKNAREISKEELNSLLISSKEKMAKELSIQGASSQEISIRLNMPHDTVEQLFATGKSLVDIGNHQVYTNPKEIRKYISPEKQMFVLTTNEHRLQSLVLRNADMSAKLDQKAIFDANQEIVKTALESSQSSFAKEVYDELLGQDKLWAIIRTGLDRITNENMGSVMTQSADFMMRRLGPVGEYASVLGQTNVNLHNRFSEEMLKGAVAKVRAHVSSQVGNNEFNKVINILQGLSGWRGLNERGELIQRIGFRKELDPVTKKMKEIPMYQPVTDVDGRSLYLTEGMKDILRDFQTISREQFHLKNTINAIQGFKEIDDIGLHIPAFNPRNKFISYVIDRQATLPNERVRLLIGKTAQELADLEHDWKAKYGQTADRFQLINKSDQKAYNFWQQRLDPIEMDFADISKFHTGSSAQFNIPLDDQYAQTIINNWHGRFIHYGKQLQQLYLSDIFDTLDVFSKVNRRGFDDQPINTRIFAANQPKDSALAFKNVLLGNSQLDASETWKASNATFANIMDFVIQSIQKPSQAFADNIVDGKYGVKAAWAKANGTTMEEVTWRKFEKQLEDSGLGKSPWKSFQEYQTIQNLPDVEKQKFLNQNVANQQWSERIAQLQRDDAARRLGIPPAKAEEFIAAGASLLTMTALRVLETGQAFINAISWPIMTLPNLFISFGKTELAAGSQVTFPFKLITDGIRFRHSAIGKSKVQQWINEGFATPIVSEVGELNQLLATGGKTATARIEQLVNSDLVRTLSKPTEFSERETRLWSLSVGYQAFKTAFPQATEVEADMFAKAFLTRTVGNYYAGQRPALFQGQLGATIGLFQTYMLSWVQNAFRGIEEGNMKALSSQMLSQMGIFGMASMPLYQQFSNFIGEHFSDKHFDLTTGTYRAMPDPIADFVVHGLPASLGVGLYTRGNMQPRIPFAQENLTDTIAAINVIRQGYGTMSAMMTNAMNAQGFADKSRAILEGISTQSLSRPVARMAELFPMPGPDGRVEALGSSTREGNTVGTSSMVWSVPGVLSRVFASRSSAEQIKRDMLYLSSYYGAIDSDNRKEATQTLKIALRNGDLNEEKFARISERYLRSGTAVGLRSAINEALSTTEGGIDYTLSRKFRDGSPFNQMIDWGW